MDPFCVRALRRASPEGIGTSAQPVLAVRVRRPRPHAACLPRLVPARTALTTWPGSGSVAIGSGSVGVPLHILYMAEKKTQ